jgi:hypothetical protein
MAETRQRFESKKGKKKTDKPLDEISQPQTDNEIKVHLQFKRYIHDEKKKMIQ